MTAKEAYENYCKSIGIIGDEKSMQFFEAGFKAKKCAKEIREGVIQYAEYVFMKESEYAKLTEEFGLERTKRLIEILNNYKGSVGKPYKNDYMAIRNWVVGRMLEEEMKPQPRKYVNPENLYK